MNEKTGQDLPAPITATAPPPKQRSKKTLLAHLLLVCSTLYFMKTYYFDQNLPSYSSSIHNCHHHDEEVIDFAEAQKSLCPISPKIVPEQYDEFKDTVDKILFDPDFRVKSAEKLSGAVQIRTEVTDKTKFLPLDDPSFAPFVDFHHYLKEQFPLVHKSMTKEVVNEYGLVFTWDGADPSLKPLLLTAHQDVVPVEWATEDQWSHHPYSGHYDGEYVWGRGSSDCKNLLIGLMESMELLIETGYSPKRTVILAFGYDEEASGVIGAKKISEFLYERYGKDSMYALIDEGSSGVIAMEGQYFASLATGEKGYLDSMITLTTPGGHSSVPPDHTSIGIMSTFISLIEKTPFKPSLPSYNPLLGMMQCIASYSDEMAPALRQTILNADRDETANKKLIEYLSNDKLTKYLISTSQAVDIIHGGIKSNALPESVSVVINSRVNVDSSVSETQDKIAGNLLLVANRFDLGVVVNGITIKEPTANGLFNYTRSTPLEVAPISPHSGEMWDIYVGSLRHVYEDLVYGEQLEGKPVIATPGMSTGNTDTKYYWDLTKNIYRYQPGALSDSVSLGGIHSVNENVLFQGHLNIVAFYYEYIRNVDSFSSEQ
ncbi:Gly-Xaa carboxypeptidase [Saccharomycopsis crataegensis]|uniref:Gly-Xaa carboxypeptidase n=1 Tax=Saccharomycopsis crataegensis TaxID=43959 RepID=A0AAV5QUR5_9ASCO|nr:Gly-Xaa carboxypeptidase [Saccharomycopsis crataegensis]